MMMRHYVHPECTPTRVSFQTGRLPMHSGQSGLCSPTWGAAVLLPPTLGNTHGAPGSTVAT